MFICQLMPSNGKDLLRENGAQVLEFSGDFGEAITAGRKKTNADPNGYLSMMKTHVIYFLAIV